MTVAIGVAPAGGTSAQSTARPARTHKHTPAVLLVGTYHGHRGQYSSIQAAVDAAKPGDWILVAPGDYHEQADHRAYRGPQPGNTPAGVVISTPDIHLRGMDRNTVVVDGTKRGTRRRCSADPARQDFGPSNGYGGTYGRDGIMVWKADNVSVENLTVCNFLAGSGYGGNEIWWNGGYGQPASFGQIGLHGYRGAFLTTTSTFFRTAASAAQYGIYSTRSSGGMWNQVYSSNFNDSDLYVGACLQVCNVTIDHAHAEYGALGYSGTDAGGSLVVENSEFDNNIDGFDTNSDNSPTDGPSPQDGTCPNGGISPITHTHSCWVFMHNYVHDNNNPNVPLSASGAGSAPTGTGVSFDGGRNDTVIGNRIENNGAWGIILTPFPDTESPPPSDSCRGGINAGPPSNACVYDDWGLEVANNTFRNNGFFKNETNGDIAEITETSAPTNCYHGNTDSSGNLTTSPSGLQQSKPTCDRHTAPPDPNPSFTNQILCDTQLVSGTTGVATPCTPGSNYPRHTEVVMHPLPKGLETMPDPCQGVPDNPWCEQTVVVAKCVSGPAIHVNLRAGRRQSFVRVTILKQGRTLRTFGPKRLRGHNPSLTVRLPTSTRTHFSLRLVEQLKSGTRVILRRIVLRYHACAAPSGR